MSFLERGYRLSTHLDFVVIGAQKAGSTLVARGLGQHPDVWMPTDEVPVFRDPIYDPVRLTAFRAMLDRHSGERLRGIKCPDYLARAEVAARLSVQPKRSKLVVCLRDPVARAISSYFWHVRWGLLPIEEPSAGLRKVLNGTYRRLNPVVDDILEWGLYGKHLGHYLKYFSRSEIHVLFNDDLRTMPQRAFEGTFQFLGLDANFRPAAENGQVNEGVYSKQRLRFLSLRNRHILHWNAERTYANIHPANGVLPRLASWSVAATDRLILSYLYSNEKPVIPPEVMRQLREYYASDIAELEGVLQHDLEAWK